jgi:quercetin dioxygenase-like cupin family protein
MRKNVSFGGALMILCGLVLFAAVAAQSQQSAPPDHGMFTPGAIQWKDGPAALPPGSKWAILEGDPAKEGPFTIRLSFPAGYKIQPHWHPNIEHTTVISGTSNLGMGDKFDKTKGNKLPAGSFSFLPPKTNHFAWFEEDSVLQVHAIGPWGVVYVNPADDPRQAKK